MRIEKAVSIVLFVGSFTFVGCELSSLAQSSWTPGAPVQFGHVHKPYDADGQEQPQPFSNGPATSSDSSSSKGVSATSQQSPKSSSASLVRTSSRHSHAAPAKLSIPSGSPSPITTQSRPAYSTQRTTVQEPVQPTKVQELEPEQPTTLQEQEQPTTMQDSQQQAAVQQSSQLQQQQVGGVLRGIGNALKNSGVVNRLRYPNNSAYPNNAAYPNNGTPLGAFTRNFSGKPALVNGVPYLGGALPSSPGQSPKFQIGSLKDDFPLPVGQDDLETFDNKQLAQRANGGWIQRHYIIGTEGGGIIGRHGPQWHVGGQH